MASLCVFLVILSCIIDVDAFRSRQRKVEMPWSDFDDEPKGLVHVDEFASKLLPRIEQLGVDDVSETVERVTTSIDLDGDGFVSKSEYHAGLALLEKTVRQQKAGKGGRRRKGHATPAPPLPTPLPTPPPTPRPTPAPTEAPTDAPLTLAPTPSGTIKKVIFGGARGQTQYGDKVWKRRPEWAKYERCSMTHCEECDGDVSCWHAAGGGYLSKVETTAAAPSDFVNYTLVVHAKCETSADTRFSVTTWFHEGGTLKAFWDMELVKTIAAGSEKAGWHTALNGESAKEFRLTWIPTQLESFCTLQVDVAEVSAGFTQCQDQQVCLEKLGSGSNLEEGLRLREENHLLKECLDGDTGSFSNALEDKCEEWLGCIDQTEGMREHLSTALVAAKVTTTVEYGVVPDDPSCVNPAISDVFSWECDCYEVAEIKCKENYQHMPLDECLNMMLCCSDKVCNSWKRTTGCDPDWCAASGSLLENRLKESEVLRGNDDDIPQALLEHSSSQVQLKDGVEDLDNALGSKACI